MVRDGTITSRKTIVTEYISGFIYEGEGGEAGPDPQDIKLQFFGHEEGRVRYVAPSSVHPEKWVYDYFVKDHLGNTRLVLTDEQQVDQYPAATMEEGMANEEENYYQNLETSRADKPSNYPNDTYTDPNLKAAKLEGDINRIGPAIILRVMAGDKINLRVNSWYDHNGTPLNIDIGPVRDEIVNALINGISAKSGGKLGTGSLTSGILNPGIMAFLNDRDNTTDDEKAQAFVNVLLLNDQFKPVITGDGKNTWTEQVGADGEFKEHILEGREMTMNGYLYIYVSNETHHQPVFFDNLQVTHIRGPLLEETHYYPIGLIQQGISSKALSFGDPQNKEKTFQGQRFDNDLGVNWIQFNWRTHDPQIGRFLQVDPLSEEYEYNSTYAFSENKVTTHVELEGLEAEWFERQVERDLRDINSKKITREQLEARVNARNNAGAAAYAIVSLFTPGPDEAIVLGALGTAAKIGTKADKIKDVVKGVDKVDDKIDDAKKVPNPNGKKGGPEHQKKMDEVAEDLKKEGYDQVNKEVKVETPGGTKDKRYIDVQGTNTTTGSTKQVQVGKQNKNGTPVSREKKALDDVENATGTRPTFVPYNKQ